MIDRTEAQRRCLNANLKCLYLSEQAVLKHLGALGMDREGSGAVLRTHSISAPVPEVCWGWPSQLVHGLTAKGFAMWGPWIPVPGTSAHWPVSQMPCVSGMTGPMAQIRSSGLGLCSLAGQGLPLFEGMPHSQVLLAPWTLLGSYMSEPAGLKAVQG